MKSEDTETSTGRRNIHFEDLPAATDSKRRPSLPSIGLGQLSSVSSLPTIQQSRTPKYRARKEFMASPSVASVGRMTLPSLVAERPISQRRLQKRVDYETITLDSLKIDDDGDLASSFMKDSSSNPSGNRKGPIRIILRDKHQTLDAGGAAFEGGSLTPNTPRLQPLSGATQRSPLVASLSHAELPFEKVNMQKEGGSIKHLMRSASFINYERGPMRIMLDGSGTDEWNKVDENDINSVHEEGNIDRIQTNDRDRLSSRQRSPGPPDMGVTFEGDIFNDDPFGFKKVAGGGNDEKNSDDCISGIEAAPKTSNRSRSRQAQHDDDSKVEETPRDDQELIRYSADNDIASVLVTRRLEGLSGAIPSRTLSNKNTGSYSSSSSSSSSYSSSSSSSGEESNRFINEGRTSLSPDRIRSGFTTIRSSSLGDDNDAESAVAVAVPIISTTIVVSKQKNKINEGSSSPPPPDATKQQRSLIYSMNNDLTVGDLGTEPADADCLQHSSTGGKTNVPTLAIGSSNHHVGINGEGYNNNRNNSPRVTGSVGSCGPTGKTSPRSDKQVSVRASPRGSPRLDHRPQPPQQQPQPQRDIFSNDTKVYKAKGETGMGGATTGVLVKDADYFLKQAESRFSPLATGVVGAVGASTASASTIHTPPLAGKKKKTTVAIPSAPPTSILPSEGIASIFGFARVDRSIQGGFQSPEPAMRRPRPSKHQQKQSAGQPLKRNSAPVSSEVMTSASDKLHSSSGRASPDPHLSSNSNNMNKASTQVSESQLKHIRSKSEFMHTVITSSSCDDCDHNSNGIKSAGTYNHSNNNDNNDNNSNIVNLQMANNASIGHPRLHGAVITTPTSMDLAAKSFSFNDESVSPNEMTAANVGGGSNGKGYRSNSGGRGSPNSAPQSSFVGGSDRGGPTPPTSRKHSNNAPMVNARMTTVKDD